MIRTLLLLGALLLSGCAGLTTGKYPYPSGIEVVPEKRQMAKISTPELEAFQEITGYTPDFALIGIVVPLIPIGEWLTGVNREDLTVGVNLWVKPKTEPALFDAATLGIEFNGRKYLPSEVKMGSMCGVEKLAIVVDVSKPVTVTEKTCIWFRFPNFAPPDTSFTVVATGLPPVRYELERKTRYQFGFLRP